MAQRQNYSAKADLRKRQQVAAGLVSERFPAVKGMVIQMTYFRKGLNPVLMLRTVNVFPTCYAYFNMDCMISGCTDGGFDLTPIIKDMVKKHESVRTGTLACRGKGTDLAADHANIAYEIGIKFSKDAPKAAKGTVKVGKAKPKVAKSTVKVGKAKPKVAKSTAKVGKAKPKVAKSTAKVGKAKPKVAKSTAKVGKAKPKVSKGRAKAGKGKAKAGKKR